MKIIVLSMFMMNLVIGAVPAFAEKNVNDNAMNHADENAVFNRMSDWFVTAGKTKEEKQAILAQRRADRAKRRAEQELNKQSKKINQDIKSVVAEAKSKSPRVKKEIPTVVAHN